VLPLAVGLALAAAFAIGIHAAKVVKRRAKLDWRLRQGLEFLTAVEAGTDLEAPVNANAKRVAEALKDNCVLIFDMSEYHSARARLRWVSKMLAVACLAALVTAGGANLLFSVCRILLIGLLWTHHEWSTAALTGSATAIAERFGTASRAVELLGATAPWAWIPSAAVWSQLLIASTALQGELLG